MKFQHLFEKEFHETSQNFNSFSLFRQLLFSVFLLSDWVEILWGFKQMLKVSAFYLEKQKSFIPKKKYFWPLSISKQKSFVYWLNFLEGFAQNWRFSLQNIDLVKQKICKQQNNFWIEYENTKIKICKSCEIYIHQNVSNLLT